jgi:hypothetical protein
MLYHHLLVVPAAELAEGVEWLLPFFAASAEGAERGESGEPAA